MVCVWVEYVIRKSTGSTLGGFVVSLYLTIACYCCIFSRPKAFFILLYIFEVSVMRAPEGYLLEVGVEMMGRGYRQSVAF